MSTRPEFKPDVPAPLLLDATERDRWMYEQQSIQRQQNNWIIDQLAKGEERFSQADTDRTVMRSELTKVSDRLIVIEKIKERLSAKWAIVVLIASALLGPIIMCFIGAAFTRWLEKIWK